MVQHSFLKTTSNSMSLTDQQIRHHTERIKQIRTGSKLLRDFFKPTLLISEKVALYNHHLAVFMSVSLYV
jgi:hypothetical protein